LRIFTSYIIETHKYGNSYSNPFEGIKRRFVKYEPKAVTSNDFFKLLQVISKENGVKVLKSGERKNYYRDWLKDAFWLGLYTGGRRDEVVRLKWSDIVYDENGQPSHFNCSDYKFNRSHNDIVTDEERKVKQFLIYSDFMTFLERIGYSAHRNSDSYVLAPESSYKRETMIDLISKAFTQFLSKTDIREKLLFKNLRKTFSTSVRNQCGDQAHLITSHGGLSVIDKHYHDKTQVQNKMKKEFEIFKKV
jgi:integrase